MKTRRATFVACMVAVAVVACTAPVPSPSLSATPSPFDSPEPGELQASHEAIVQAVGRWLAMNKSHELTSKTFLLTDLVARDPWYEPGDLPELGGAVRIWSDELSVESQLALQQALIDIATLEPVNDSRSVVDEEAFGELNCHPWIGGRALIRLQRTLAIGDRYFVEANIDQGCRGVVALLQIELVGSNFDVTAVIRDGHWIV